MGVLTWIFVVQVSVRWEVGSLLPVMDGSPGLEIPLVSHYVEAEGWASLRLSIMRALYLPRARESMPQQLRRTVIMRRMRLREQGPLSVSKSIQTWLTARCQIVSLTQLQGRGHTLCRLYGQIKGLSRLVLIGQLAHSTCTSCPLTSSR